jgi:hypothetical protein
MHNDVTMPAKNAGLCIVIARENLDSGHFEFSRAMTANTSIPRGFQAL